MKKYYLSALFICGLVSSAIAHADDATNLEEIVVTAARLEQPLSQTLSSTSVITQEDIKNSQATDVPTILRSVAGVELSQSGGMGKLTSLFLRGSNSTQVLVLLDGVRINSATADITAIQDLMLDQIERIEIVRGNVSSLYGSEAIGGVIQIFTKKGHGTPAMNASIGVGNLGTQRVTAGYGGTVFNTDFHLQISSFNTTGVSAINPALNASANPDTDGYRNTSVSANVRHILNEDHALSANFFNSMGNNQYDNQYGPTSVANTNTQKLSKISINSDDRLSDNWNSHLQLAQGIDEYHDLVDGIPVYYSGVPASLIKTTNQQLAWQNTLKVIGNNQLLLGVENLTQKVDADTNYAVNRRIINSIYAGYTATVGAHQLQTNLRQDINSQFGSVNTGLFGYGYKFNQSLRFTTRYSTAFRAPTFNDLYYPSDAYGVYSDPNLKPERSTNIEAGLNYVADKQHINIVYFDNHINDAIILNSSYFPVNVNQVINDGLELSYSDLFYNTTIKATLTSQNPRDEATGKTLDRRAKLHGGLSFSRVYKEWQLGGEWLKSGERTDGTHTLASYDVFNITAAYELNKETSLSFRAENITDQNDATGYSYNPLGRTLFVSMSYHQ